MRQAIRAWLKAGRLEGQEFSPSEEGTPQGGVISPLLANIALHGMETELSKIGRTTREKPLLVRYADDFMILHQTRQSVEKARTIVETWLSGMNLHLNPHKTRITHTLNPTEDQEAGFDFLGYS